MQPVQPQRRTRRRAHSTTTHTVDKPAVVKRRKRLRQIGNAMIMAILAAVVALMVLVSPAEPLRHAYYTIGTADNAVATTGSAGEYYRGLVISEVMPSNKTAMPDENGGYPDWVEIWNNSDHAVDMKNVGLSDDELSISFLFPDITLMPDERVIVICDKTNQAIAGKPLHAKFGLSSNGETLSLYDPNAYIIDSVRVPIMSSDESYARMADGEWQQTSFYSPGYENSEAGYLAYRSATMVTDGALIINEICPDPLTGYRDADGELCDWIELYNPTNEPVSLANYALSNKENKPLKWRFPEGAYVAPRGYYIVYCSGKDVKTGATGVPHANFRISAEHDTIVLSDSRGRLVDRVTIDNIPEDASYARGADGSFSVHVRTTPQLPNTLDGANQMDIYLRALNDSGVYVTEVMASNDTTKTAEGADFVDWIELYNSSGSTVDLSGYGLSDSLGRARKWQFPEGTYIQPGSYKIVWCDGDAASSTAAEPHTSFRLTKGGLETLVLADPTGKILDKVVLPEIPTNVSYGRTMGREGFFYYDLPSPGQPNAAGFLGYAEMPELTVEPGHHKQGTRVALTIPEGTSVFYTTDGSIPTQMNGKPYSGELIELNFTTLLRARAFPFDNQYKPSQVVTGSYLINAFHTLPVVSLSVDPWELWNPDTGMLVIGEGVVKEPGKLPFKNTVYRKYGKEAREGYIEYFDESGQQVLSQGISIQLAGDYSLDLPQKSFKLRAKSLYGDKVFAAALFPDRPYTEYKGIVLRNCGNDGVWTRLVDGLQSRLIDSYQFAMLEKDTDGSYAESMVIHQAWKPVSVYLNGVYWGHYNLRERVDRFFVAQHEGIPLEQASEMDIIGGSGSADFGSNKAYKAFLKELKSRKPGTNAEDRAFLDDNVDVDNLIEYMAFEMFFGNSDIGNTRFYRLHGTDPDTGKPYKWKWILYDMDYGLFNSSFNSPYSYTKKEGMGQMKIDNTIFLSVLSVPEYRERFLYKLGEIFQTFTTDYMMAMLVECKAEIEPEMDLHFARWAEEHDKNVITEWPTDVSAAKRYWENRISRLQNALKKRPNLLWGYVRDQFQLSNAQMEEYFGPRPEMPKDVV